MKINFPVFVLAKDCGEITRFDSIDEMQRELERIDVEHNEYAAWECNGRALELKTQQPSWLCLELLGASADKPLAAALENYAASLDVSLKIGSSTPERLNKAYEEIRAHVQKRGLLSRFFSRSKS